MPRQAAFAGWFLLSAPMLVAGQVTPPPGYQDVLKLTNSSVVDAHPRINNRGQIVWETRVHGTDESGEIFLWENGNITRVTNDNVRDSEPEIADDGTIVWTRFMGPQWQFGPTGEVMMRKPDGSIVRITDNAYEERGPALNRSGEVVWSRTLAVNGCFGSTYDDVYHFDGSTIRPITVDAIPEEVSNQGARINDHGDIVWTRYDICAGQGPFSWQATIWLLSKGQRIQVSLPGSAQPQVPKLNNARQVMWYAAPLEPVPERHVEVWDNGVNSTLTNWGQNPSLNDHGDVYFIRWHAEDQAYQAWLFRRGQFFRLSHDPFWNTDGSIANNGDIVWRSGPSLEADIRYLQRFGYGDLNCDGVLDAFDIEPFIDALLDPASYQAAFPNCDSMLADVNEDGAVDAFDIEAFVGLLTP